MRQRRALAAAVSRRLRQRKQPLAQRVEIDLHGIVMHQQRAIGRHGLGDAFDRRARQRAIERQHALIGGIVDSRGNTPP